MPPKAAEVAQKAKPWPGYFLVRTTGEVVPLIALDELAPGIEIVGVPRCLDLEATVGMLNLGLQRSSGAFYHMIDHHQDDEDEADAVARSPTPQTPTPPSTPPRQVAKHQACTSPSLAKSSHNPANSKGTIMSRPETQICRHWCAHGICKWGQQCRYRHIMPMTIPGLQEVGLGDWPTWYRSLNPGYFVSESMKRQKERLNREVVRQMNRMNEERSAPGLQGTGGGRGERLRANRRPRAPLVKRQDLGEQIIARLRGMSGALKVEQVEKMVAARKAADLNTPSALVERAAARDTKDWEEENGVAGDDKDSDVSLGTESKAQMAKGKLVDV